MTKEAYGFFGDNHIHNCTMAAVSSDGGILVGEGSYDSEFPDDLKDSDSFLMDCFLVADGTPQYPGPRFRDYGDGKIVCRLWRYAIVPREEYEELHELARALDCALGDNDHYFDEQSAAQWKRVFSALSLVRERGVL